MPCSFKISPETADERFVTPRIAIKARFPVVLATKAMPVILSIVVVDEVAPVLSRSILNGPSNTITAATPRITEMIYPGVHSSPLPCTQNWICNFTRQTNSLSATNVHCLWRDNGNRDSEVCYNSETCCDRRRAYTTPYCKTELILNKYQVWDPVYSSCEDFAQHNEFRN